MKRSTSKWLKRLVLAALVLSPVVQGCGVSTQSTTQAQAGCSFMSQVSAGCGSGSSSTTSSSTTPATQPAAPTTTTTLGAASPTSTAGATTETAIK